MWVVGKSSASFVSTSTQRFIFSLLQDAGRYAVGKSCCMYWCLISRVFYFEDEIRAVDLSFDAQIGSFSSLQPADWVGRCIVEALKIVRIDMVSKPRRHCLAVPGIYIEYSDLFRN